MRRVIAIALAGASLAGCSSFGNYFKSQPPMVQIQLESNPPGADATTSQGGECKTPCSVSVPVPDSNTLTVTYALDKYQPATVPVNVTRTPGSFSTPATMTADPNPVFAELKPVGPPPRHHKALRPRKKKPSAPPPADGGSPFPNPNAPPPPPPPPAH